MKKKERENEYWKRRVKNDFVPKVDERKKLEIEIRSHEKKTLRTFSKVKLKDIVTQDAVLS
jgi:hypothetical protein